MAERAESAQAVLASVAVPRLSSAPRYVPRAVVPEDEVEALSAELEAGIQEVVADCGEGAPDEGSIAIDLLSSMAYGDEYAPDVFVEVARRTFGFLPSDMQRNSRIAQAWRAVTGVRADGYSW